MSIEQAASGINVTEATHVFFAHPIFGATPEVAISTYSQCIGRAHRLGQKHDVQAKLFVTIDSLEENLIQQFSEAVTRI
jgi:SNF2 family DNA or RNA helicase